MNTPKHILPKLPLQTFSHHFIASLRYACISHHECHWPLLICVFLGNGSCTTGEDLTFLSWSSVASLETPKVL